MTIKVPRTRISDCKRLVFDSSGARWIDIDEDPIIFPHYPMPQTERKVYSILSGQVHIKPGMWINDLVRQVCSLFQGLSRGQGLPLERMFLHTIRLERSGEGFVEYDVLN